MGDWIIGTGSSPTGRQGCLVYAMRITETMTFNEYWEDGRFQRKKPNLRGSKKQAFGDNIYFKDEAGQWHQQNSHHSRLDGSSNPHNISQDTKADRVLLSKDYSYWGGAGPEIPTRLRDYDGYDICAIRNHKSLFPEKLVKDFVEWLGGLDTRGYLGAPLDWKRTP